MIELRDVSVRFGTDQALRGVDLTVVAGQRLGIVGESGCGKSMLGLLMMGMLPESAALDGEILLDGEPMHAAPELAWQSVRARRVAMVFQEPMAALNPLRRVGETVMEPLLLHLGLSRTKARDRVLALFDEVGIQDPEAKLRQFPHELSGGQRQRVLIALALACDPGLLIADEPTTALDAHVALRITDLLVRLSEERGMALIFISHDLAAVARTAETITVMYGGEIVEHGATHALLGHPAHPYTQGLIDARPSLSPDRLRQKLTVIPGAVPALADLPAGCRFSGRCPVEMPQCGTRRPHLQTAPNGGRAACHRLDEAVA